MSPLRALRPWTTETQNHQGLRSLSFPVISAPSDLSAARKSITMALNNFQTENKKKKNKEITSFQAQTHLMEDFFGRFGVVIPWSLGSCAVFMELDLF